MNVAHNYLDLTPDDTLQTIYFMKHKLELKDVLAEMDRKWSLINITTRHFIWKKSEGIRWLSDNDRSNFYHEAFNLKRQHKPNDFYGGFHMPDMRFYKSPRVGILLIYVSTFNLANRNINYNLSKPNILTACKMNGIKGINKKNRKELVKALMKCGDEVDLSRFDGVSTK